MPYSTTISVTNKPYMTDWVNSITIAAGETLRYRRDEAEYTAAHTHTLIEFFSDLRHVDKAWHWNWPIPSYYDGYWFNFVQQTVKIT